MPCIMETTAARPGAALLALPGRMMAETIKVVGGTERTCPHARGKIMTKGQRYQPDGCGCEHLGYEKYEV